ncbi:hypothetical protein [Halorussus pelagicus]|uniref:hypothetical protein n=1 Tax=Halorussus pelagicus TaxID=2505977 RepID=UPI000FFB2A1A|nr:hypothetical protein [Halorussus pelagicus]
MATRRDYLALSGSAFAASLSGCLSSGLLAGGPPDVQMESEPPERGVPTANPDLSANSTVTTLAVGRGSDHRQVWLWNETDRNLEVAVEISREGDGEPWFQQSYDLDTDVNLAIDLRESRDYAITVGVPDRTETVEISKSEFDCNASVTDVAIRATEFDTASIKTTEGCKVGFW